MRSGCRTATRTEKSRSRRRWTTRWPRKPVPPKKVTFPCAIVLFLAMLSDAILAGAAEIRKKRVARMRGYPQWRWHLDEVFVKVNGKLCDLWRAVDHEGEVLEAVVTWLIALSQVRPCLVAAPSSRRDFGPRFGRRPRRPDAFRPLSFCGAARAWASSLPSGDWAGRQYPNSSTARDAPRGRALFRMTRAGKSGDCSGKRIRWDRCRHACGAGRDTCPVPTASSARRPGESRATPHVQPSYRPRADHADNRSSQDRMNGRRSAAWRRALRWPARKLRARPRNCPQSWPGGCGQNACRDIWRVCGAAWPDWCRVRSPRRPR